MHKYIPMILNPMILKQVFSAILIASALSACSTLQFPGVYKVTIEQGNVITQEMVDQLKPGMSREQVEYIMGSALIKDSFNEQRWDYVYSIQKGDKARKQSRLTIFFEGDKLKYFTGDFVPSTAPTTVPTTVPTTAPSATLQHHDAEQQG